MYFYSNAEIFTTYYNTFLHKLKALPFSTIWHTPSFSPLHPYNFLQISHFLTLSLLFQP